MSYYVCKVDETCGMEPQPEPPKQEEDLVALLNQLRQRKAAANKNCLERDSDYDYWLGVASGLDDGIVLLSNLLRERGSMESKNNDISPILVWPFQMAPEGYRVLSRHGGDEDWVIFSPYGRISTASDLVERLDVAGNPTRVEMADGVVWITAHA